MLFTSEAGEQQSELGGENSLWLSDLENAGILCFCFLFSKCEGVGLQGLLSLLFCLRHSKPRTNPSLDRGARGDLCLLKADGTTEEQLFWDPEATDECLLVQERRHLTCPEKPRVAGELGLPKLMPKSKHTLIYQISFPVRALAQ